MSGIMGATDRLAGYQKWDGHDPWEDRSGPFYYRQRPDGLYECAFEAGPHSVNAGGAIHGGCLMTFADYALFVFAKPALDTAFAVTVSFSSEFVGAGFAGDFVEAEGTMTRETGSLIFSRGTLFTRRDSEPDPVVLLTFSGVLKKVRS